MAAQLRFIRWSLPAFALIIGIFWYKRRRVQRGDPGGKSIQSRDCDLRHSELEIKEEKEPTQPEPQKEIPPTASPVEHSRSISNSRKSSDSLNQQVRRSPPQPIIFTKSVVERHHRSADWYQSDDDDVIEQLNRTDPVLNKKSNRKAQMAAKKHCESPEQGSLEANAAAEEKHEVQVEPLEFKKEVIKDMELAKKDKKEEVDEESKTEEKKEEKEFEPNDIRSQVEERDSANHSPVSGVLEGSVTDEVRSEGSTDSGKGGSIKGHMICGNQTYYDFLVPSELVGRLIGRNGNSLHHIRSKSGARINIKKRPVINDDFMVCVVEGTPEAIQIALAQIRKKFPINLFPSLTMDQLGKIPKDVIVPAPLTQLMLTEGINNDVIVCNIVRPDHFFVQIATHPSFPALKTLEDNMTQLYNTYDSPAVPLDLAKDQIVAVFLLNKWMRALIVEPDPTGESTAVRLLDHGGYWSVSHAAMRQIRNDYLSLPFQAIEVFLANVKPISTDWDPQAYEIVRQACTIVGQAQVVAYVDDKTYVNVFFSIPKHGLISLAEELVGRGLAELVPLDEKMKDGWSQV